MKKHLFLLPLLCGAFVLTNCVNNNEEEGDVTDKMTWVTDPKMTTEFSQYLGWSTTITGIAQNVSGKKLSYVQCTFSLYDSNDLNLGSAIANVNNLASNDKWSVEASYLGWTDTEPVRFVFNGFSQF